MASGFRFRKSFKILPGVRLNISKKGASVSLGPSDAHITTGTSGTYFYLDLPGSGAYYRKKLDTKSKDDKAEKSQDENEESPQAPEQLDVGFLQRLTTPPNELAFVDALRALAEGEDDKAYERAKGATHLADGAFLAGFLALVRGHDQEAADDFGQALKRKDDLGEHAQKYEINLAVELPITEEISARIEPNEHDVLLALAESYQRLGMRELAIESLLHLYRLDPDDLIVRLSLVDLYAEAYPTAEQMWQRIVELAGDVHNEGPVHAALMYYRARALRNLGLIDGAKDTLTKALRRKKGYPDDLLRALRYERAVIYELTGDEKKARAEYEKIYAESPSYEDVAARLGL